MRLADSFMICQTAFTVMPSVLAGPVETRRSYLVGCCWLAHLDPNTIADPNALAARAKLTMPDLDRAFNDTEQILLKLTCCPMEQSAS
jgi:hypothetical protein